MGKHFSNILKAACLGMACLLFPALSDAEPGLKVKHLANEQNIIDIPCAGKYLLLPVQDNAPEGKIYIVKDNEYVSSQPVNIRLAREQVDYYVPLDLSAFAGESVRIDVQGMPAPSICWKHISLSDEFDSSNCLRMDERPERDVLQGRGISPLLPAQSVRKHLGQHALGTFHQHRPHPLEK